MEEARRRVCEGFMVGAQAGRCVLGRGRSRGLASGTNGQYFPWAHPVNLPEHFIEDQIVRTRIIQVVLAHDLENCPLFLRCCYHIILLRFREHQIHLQAEVKQVSQTGHFTPAIDACANQYEDTQVSMASQEVLCQFCRFPPSGSGWSSNY